jgi:Fur family transcriptional regulator, stress-responsive regulator
VVADVDCTVGQAPCLDPHTARGFEVDEAEVTFWGLCPACQALRAAD